MGGNKEAASVEVEWILRALTFLEDIITWVWMVVLKR